MTTITDKAMQATPTQVDQWLSQPFKRGTGVFLGRITPAGERLFYFRYTDSKGSRPFLPIGKYHSKGSAGGITLAQGYKKAAELSTLYQAGIRDLREHFANLESQIISELEAKKLAIANAEQVKTLEDSRKTTVRMLFDNWVKVELQPHIRTDGKRIGRKDGGQYTKEQFERRIFGPLGEMEAKSVHKTDIRSILDSLKAEGKLRTANMLLADLRQMFGFALDRDIVDRNPMDSIKKRSVGGADVERTRRLSIDEIRTLGLSLTQANMTHRSQIAVRLILATACRVSELMNGKWEHVDFAKKTWFLPTTKNQRSHTIHLSVYTIGLLEQLQALQTIVEHKGNNELTWLFPNKMMSGPVCVKSFGKQLNDRQKPTDKPWLNRTSKNESLVLPGGHWTAHDLRRTASNEMARMGVISDVIDECLNHKIVSKSTRVYVQDRRLVAQAEAFDLWGSALQKVIPL
jgi:integrase